MDTDSRDNLDNTPQHSDTPNYSDSTISIQPKHTSSRHRAMMRYLIAGKTPGEIADIFELTNARVSVIINSPLFKEEMRKMEGEVRDEFVQNEGGKVHTDSVRGRLAEEALRALDTIVGFRDNATSERVRQLSALEILDRAGYKASEKIEGTVEIDASEGLVNAIQGAIAAMQKTGKEKCGLEEPK